VNRLGPALSAILLCATHGSVVHLSVGQDKTPRATVIWQKLDAGQFSIFAPPGWEFHKLQGIDSYVGEFVGDGVRLSFDFGEYSNPLDEAKSPTYLISDEYVGGFKARIVYPIKSGHGITGIYFPNVGHRNKLTVDVQNLDIVQREKVLTMFRSIQFR
jgi:hypothetical protein